MGDPGHQYLRELLGLGLQMFDLFLPMKCLHATICSLIRPSGVLLKNFYEQWLVLNLEVFLCRIRPHFSILFTQTLLAALWLNAGVWAMRTLDTTC